MRVLRGRAASVEEDREVTQALVKDVKKTGEVAVRAWRPHRQVAFGRRDARSEGYERAREIAREGGFPPCERRVGGRAVVYTGSTVAFARVEPVADARTGIQTRYERVTADLQDALLQLGVRARPGEPHDSFCPGTHSLRAGGKIVGIAQHVRREGAVAAGVVVTRDHAEIAAVLNPIYGALGVPFDPDSVGSVERAGGDADPEMVARAVEQALVDEGDPHVERVGHV